MKINDPFRPVTNVKKIIHFPHKSKTQAIKRPITDRERELMNSHFDILLDAFPQFEGTPLISTIHCSYIMKCKDRSFIFRYDSPNARVTFQERLLNRETGKGMTLTSITHDVYQDDEDFNSYCMLDEFFEWSADIVAKYYE